MKTRIIILICLLIITVKGHAQIQNDTLQSVRNKLIGEWVRMNNSNAKIKFYENGSVELKEGGEIVTRDKFEVAASCNGSHTIPFGTDFPIYLLIKDDDGTILDCDVINNINYKDSNVLSITTGNQGKHVAYERL